MKKGCLSLNFELTYPEFDETGDWWRKTQKEYSEEYWKKDLKPYWEDEKDPNSNEPWTPRKRPEKHKILRKTGKMQDTAKIYPRGKLFSVKTVAYGIKHQTGTKKLSQRRWLGFSKESMLNFSKISKKYICKNVRTVKF